MKKIIYLFLLIFLSNCIEKTAKTPVTTVSDCELLGQQLEPENDTYKLEFSDVEVAEIKIDGENAKIILEKIDSWYYSEKSVRLDWNDPGDFHRIRIEYKDTTFVFFNQNGWVKTSPFMFDYVPTFPSYNKIKSDCIVLTKNDDDLLLFAFGYVYANQPGLLSIFNLSLKEPMLLFNDNYMLSGYQENNPNINVTRFFREDDTDKHETLTLKNHCLYKL